MKRIIRLTESDLARIVRRVISEGTETTTMTPESYIRIKGIGGNELEAFDTSKKNVMFKVTPSVYNLKNDKGELVRQPGKLYIKIELPGKPNTYGRTVYDCKNGTFSRSNGYIGDDYSDLNIIGVGKESNYDHAMGKQILQNTLHNAEGLFKNQGAIADMTSNYCSKV
jgi:hypothetical protein